MNFIEKKKSMLPELRDCERIMTIREIRQMAEDSLMAGERPTAAVFATVYAAEVPGRADEMLARLDGSDPTAKTR